MPTGLDRLRLTLVREIDDPDEIGATPYTLEPGKRFTGRMNIQPMCLLRFPNRLANAAYLHSIDRETLFTGDANIRWQLNPALALNGDYTFNDRQANYLRAANEHIVTLGLTWRP